MYTFFCENAKTFIIKKIFFIWFEILIFQFILPRASVN